MSISKERSSFDKIKPKYGQFLTPTKNTRFNKSFQFKKVKKLLSLNKERIKEIKGVRHLSSFHLVCEEDKYKKIEKKIQNKILDISMKIIEDDDIEVTKVDNKINQTHSKIDQKNKEKRESSFNLFNNKKNKINISNHNATQVKVTRIERYRRLKKIKNLYDSFGEDESDKDLEHGNYGFNPRSIFIDIYDMIILISSGFCLFYLPIKLAKTKMIINNDEYFALLMIDFSEIIYIIDLIFGFFRWYYNNEFKLVSNSHMIIKNYFYGNFLFDLILAIPFITIYRFQKNIDNDYKTIYNENHFLLKILICFKAFKIFKLNKEKNNRIIYYFNRKFAKYYYLERIYQIFNFIIIIYSIFNLIICFHIYFSELSYPNWITLSNLQDKSFSDIYIASLYFVIATMTSVGYGDIVCVSKEETFFQIILLSIGLVTYSYIISTVGDYVKNKSRVAMNYDRDMTKLEEIRIAYPNMPYKLYNKIQQHIQRMLTQSKKYEYNILVNNLPYYLQNSVLFQIHKNEINNFIFFKDCDNSDFILKVLTHFIPIFSKKNIVLVGEGEFLENIFFIKDGRLSLEAIIDLDNITISIEKYLKYRFEEIEKIQEINDNNENSYQNSKILKSLEKDEYKEIKSKKLLTIINKQFDNIADTSYLHESNIDQEIGKFDFHMEYQDLFQGNIQYIHILDLLKNEYYGEILMFSNIPSPLSLKVKSKRVELYVLKKKDAFNIRKEYQNIWQRINKKSIHNIKSLKSLTLDIINRYCEMNGILVRNKQIVKFKTTIYGNNLNKNQVSSKTKSKTMATSKLNVDKNKRTSLRSSFRIVGFNENNNSNNDNNKKQKENSFRFKNRNRPSLKFVQNMKFNNEINKENRRFSKSQSPKIKNKKITVSSEFQSSSSYSSSSSSSSSLSLSLSENTINKKIKKQFSEIKKLSKDNSNLIQNQKKITNKNVSKYYSQKRITRFRGNISTFASKSAKSFQNKFGTPKKSKKISTKNNPYYITGTSFQDLNTSNSNNINYITKESTISFYIPSSYKNINDLAKGIYINNNNFQNFILKAIKYYKEIISLNGNQYSSKFNNYLNIDFIKLNNKINISENNSNNCESSKNSIFNKIEASFSQPKNQKNFSVNFNQNNKDENIFHLTNEKYKIENTEDKIMNNLDKLKLNNLNKSQEILSDSNNINDESNKSINDIFKLNIRDIDIKNNNNNAKYKFKENNKKNNEKINENLCPNNIISNKIGNNIQEVNLNYVTNFCEIY